MIDIVNAQNKSFKLNNIVEQKETRYNYYIELFVTYLHHPIELLFMITNCNLIHHIVGFISQLFVYEAKGDEYSLNYHALYDSSLGWLVRNILSLFYLMYLAIYLNNFFKKFR